MFRYLPGVGPLWTLDTGQGMWTVFVPQRALVLVASTNYFELRLTYGSTVIGAIVCEVSQSSKPL